jgi:hypothetical protein
MNKMMINPMHPDFLSIIEEVSDVVSQNDFSTIILQSGVAQNIREWESKEFSDFQSKLNKKLQGVVTRENAAKKMERLHRGKLKNKSSKLDEFQMKLQKPSYMQMKKLIDQDLISIKQFKKLIQRSVSSMSVINIHHSMSLCHSSEFNELLCNAATSSTERLLSKNDYHELPLRVYTRESYERTIWRLDPTAGPNRVRMRLKVHSTSLNEFNYHPLSFDDIVEIATPLTANTSASDFIPESASSSDLLQNEGSTSTMTPVPAVEEKPARDYDHHGTAERLIIDSKVCTRVTPLQKCFGELLLGESNVYFIGKEVTYLSGVTEINTTTREKPGQYSFSYDLIREIHKRRYMLMNSALEIFLTNGKSLFLTFDQMNDRDVILDILSGTRRQYNINLSQLKLPNLKSYETEVNGMFLLEKSITQKWQEGTISNFEYLMHLNTLAGRSFNDLTQYPVFPFVLSDYTSEELDLNNPNSFRDLTKPMGALNSVRLAKGLKRYEDMEDTEEPPSFWGTHYSTPVFVCNYLVRLEPFTRCIWEINGEKLDYPDRTFHNIAKLWQISSGETHSTSDVKELIPEFYYLPEFLQNRNRIDFGVMHDNAVFDDVVLPPWAKGSPVTFVRKMREALESKYVSHNLHHWIDLIFGFKQHGDEAVRAHNVFSYMTYEGCAESIKEIEDPMLRAARWEQIRNYGQTPKKLFDKPHVAKVLHETLVIEEFYLAPQKLAPKHVKIFKESVGDLYMTMGMFV